jgi:hypothetical protein
MNEHSKNLIVSSTAIIPVLGGSISILIDKYIPSELEKRRNTLIEQLDKDIEAIKEKIKPNRLESTEYSTILFKVFKNAIEEHDQEKIKKYRAILQNSAITEYIENPEIEFYIKLLNELTTSHIKLVRLINENNFHYDIHYIHTEESDKVLQDYCIKDLERVNLISKDILSSHQITELGKRFIDFIKLQET